MFVVMNVQLITVRCIKMNEWDFIVKDVLAQMDADTFILKECVFGRWMF